MEKTIQFYNENASDYFHRTVTIDMSISYDKFFSLLPNKGKVLDAACGSGRDAKKILSRGYELEAFDASPQLVKLASEYLHHPVKCLFFEDMTYQSEFEGIWCSAALLHISSSRLGTILKKFIDALKPGGIFFFSFKHGDFEGIEKDRFFHYINQNSLETLVKQFDEINIVEIWIETAKETNQEWIQCICKKG
jgi:2-polyprenyl-3-methyl-5-hydroxy-6-metoxy-1,4-benzoquinol methylase